MDIVIQSITKKYADFSSRARRKEYWLFISFYSIFTLFLLILDMIFGLVFIIGFPPLTYIFIFATMPPSLGVTVRRLHDTNRSGWWCLIGLIPVIGAIWFWILMCLKGTEGENRFGIDPLS